MGAEKGNKYAEKWTEEEVTALLEGMEEDAKSDDILYIGDLLVKHSLYKEIWSYWKDKFKDIANVFQPIKRIEQLFEAKLFKGGVNGKLNATLVIFGLKNNHGWVDKTETDITTKGESINNRHNLSEKTDEELARLEQAAQAVADITGDTAGEVKA